MSGYELRRIGQSGKFELLSEGQVVVRFEVDQIKHSLNGVDNIIPTIASYAHTETTVNDFQGLSVFGIEQEINLTSDRGVNVFDFDLVFGFYLFLQEGSYTFAGDTVNVVPGDVKFSIEMVQRADEQVFDIERDSVTVDIKIISFDKDFKILLPGLEPTNTTGGDAKILVNSPESTDYVMGSVTVTPDLFKLKIPMTEQETYYLYDPIVRYGANLDGEGGGGVSLSSPLIIVGIVALLGLILWMSSRK